MEKGSRATRDKVVACGKASEAGFDALPLLPQQYRIGTNHGSLSDRILSQYGDTPIGMVESALEFVRICQKLNYQDKKNLFLLLLLKKLLN